MLVSSEAGFIRICLHCTCNVIQHFDLLHIITTVSANAGVVSDIVILAMSRLRDFSNGVILSSHHSI